MTIGRSWWPFIRWVAAADPAVTSVTRAASKPEELFMIFIVVKMTVRPERTDEWLTLVEPFTQATRNEPGNIFFEWSKSVENPNQFVLVEAFQDDAAAAHVNSDHFKAAMAWMPDVVAETPQIINMQLPGNDWSQMAEITPR
jgi:quinol monooxygenase YgiN